MSTELITTIKTQGEVINITPLDVRKYICPKATESEIRMFLALCKAQGLNPYVKDVHLIKYSDSSPAQIVTAKQAFMKRLELHPQFDGLQSGIIVQDKTGKVIEREGTFKLDDEKLVGGWAIVYRKDRKIPIKAPVSLREFDRAAPSGDKKNNWNTMPAVMIEKVAVVTAARKACPLELGGLYIADELPTKSDVLTGATEIEGDVVEVEFETTESQPQTPPTAQEKKDNNGNGGNGHSVTPPARKRKLSKRQQELYDAVSTYCNGDKDPMRLFLEELTAPVSALGTKQGPGRESFFDVTDNEAMIALDRFHQRIDKEAKSGDYAAPDMYTKAPDEKSFVEEWA